MEADTEKKDFDIKNVKKKAQKMRKKAMERLRETRKRKGKKWRWSWNIKVEDAVQKWLVFFEKNLNKIENLNHRTCKEKTMKGSSRKTA